MNMKRCKVWFLTAVGLCFVTGGNLFPKAVSAQEKPQMSEGGPPIVQVRQIPWSGLKESGQSLPGELVSDPNAAPSEKLVVEVSKENPTPVTLFTLEDPGVGPPGYVMNGSVKCEGIATPGYLEMWNYFPDGSFYFTRTLASAGPMAALQGTEDWRRIDLPFSINLPDPAKREKMRPNKLVLNLVLPAGGKVHLSSFQLLQYGDLPTSAALPIAPSPTSAAPATPLGGAWWSARTAGVIGGVMGSLIGVWGGLIGVLSSIGRWPRLVKGLMYACAGFGAAILVVGAIALLLGQPWAVGGTLAMIGMPATFVPLLLLPTVNRNSQARELRRMQALDVGV